MLRKWAHKFLAVLVYGYWQFTYATQRMTIYGRENMAPYEKEGLPLMAAFWHGRSFWTPLLCENRKDRYVILSRHGDGGLMATLMDLFGVLYVRGSTNRPATDEKGAKDRGGAAALRACLKVLKGGGSIGLTPDGARGPRMRVQSHITDLAARTGAPIVPFVTSSSFAIRLNNRDQTIIPLPFGRTIMTYGEPIILSKNATEEEHNEARKTLETRLNQLTESSDRKMGRDPVLPD